MQCLKINDVIGPHSRLVLHTKLRKFIEMFIEDIVKAPINFFLNFDVFVVR